MINWIKRICHRFNQWQKKIKWNQALRQAKDFAAETNKKTWIVKIDGGNVIMSKAEFKHLWKHTPAMKFRTIQQWQKHVYELKTNS